MVLNENDKNKEKAATLIGIVSWGAACGYAEYPDVYANVMNVLNWIKDVTGRGLQKGFLVVHQDDY